MTIHKAVLATVFGLLAATTAAASPINYYVSGSFLTCAGCTFNTRSVFDTPPLPFGDPSPNNEIQFSNGGNTVLINYAFLGNAASPVNVDSPTLLSYGIFNVDNLGANTTVNIGAFTFALTVHDLTHAGTGVFIGSSSGGIISNNQSTVIVNWAPGSIPIGPAVWGIFSPTELVPPTATAGETTIQGQVTDRIPEPASILLMSGGLLGVGLLGRRRM